MNEQDTQLLQKLLKDILFTNEPLDISPLKQVSPEGLMEFGHNLAESLEQPFSPAAGRDPAEQAVIVLLKHCYNNSEGIRTTPKPTDVVEINYVNGQGESSSNSGVHRRPYLHRWQDTDKDITPRVLHYYRQLNGWIALTTFSKQKQLITHDISNLIPALISKESALHKINHPHKSDAEIADYIQKEYIAHIQPRSDVNRLNPRSRKVPDRYDLSPRAQTDVLNLAQEGHVSNVSTIGEYAEALNRPGWNSFEHLDKKTRANPYAKNIKVFLDEKYFYIVKNYQDAHQCSNQDAEHHANSTYMYRAQKNNHVYRFLSPEAQEDANNYLQELILQRKQQRQGNGHKNGESPATQTPGRS